MKRLWSLYVAFFVIAIGLALASPAHAATITVSASAPDNTTSGNGCSIREAIVNANNNAATHPDCIAGSGTDTISIPAATYNIATALPAVTTPIIVDGAGPDQTIIDGQNTGGFALFQGSSTVIRDMTFLRTDSTGLSITNGDAEIYNFEYDGTGLTTETSPINYYITDSLDHSITIDGVYLHDFEITHTIGLYGIGVDTGGSNNSTSTLRNITITNIRNLDLNASVGAILIGNGTSGFENGGIHNSVLENITIQGIYGVTQAVGLVVGTLTNTETASLNATVRNITIQNIEASGGASRVAGMAVFSIATPGGNSTSQLNIQNSLTANLVTGGDKYTCFSQLVGNGGTEAATITSLGGNIAYDNSCAEMNQPTDQLGIAGLASTLGPLAVSNGALTPVIPLLAGSPAIDAGINTNCYATDQRGIARPQGSKCDAGAYEFVVAVTTPTPTPTPAAGPGESLPRVGLLYVGMPLLLATCLMAAYVYYDYLRHKAPLYAENPSVHYTFLHHLKVVTLPMFSYKVSIVVQRKEPWSG